MAATGKYAEWLESDNLIRLQGWARDGLTDEQIAKNIGITTTTFYQWKKDHPAFSEALKKGKEVVDYEVENALCKRAMGYDVTEYRDGKPFTRHIPADVTAQIFWLKHRKPKEWQDKPYEPENAGGTGLAEAIVEAGRKRKGNGNGDGDE